MNTHLSLIRVQLLDCPDHVNSAIFIVYGWKSYAYICVILKCMAFMHLTLVSVFEYTTPMHCARQK